MNTPEILERVNTIESEMLQIDEAISIQGNEDYGLSTVSIRIAMCIGIIRRKIISNDFDISHMAGERTSSNAINWKH